MSESKAVPLTSGALAASVTMIVAAPVWWWSMYADETNDPKWVREYNVASVLGLLLFACTIVLIVTGCLAQAELDCPSDDDKPDPEAMDEARERIITALSVFAVVFIVGGIILGPLVGFGGDGVLVAYVVASVIAMALLARVVSDRHRLGACRQ